jgi:uncharacterized protein
MKIAVIGATGFVGSHITNELIDRNLHVVAISRKGNQSDKNNLQYIQVDVADVNALSQALTGTDVVISAFSPAASSSNLAEEFMKGSKAIQSI